MTVRVSKPQFNLREKISELDKPSGIKGSELLQSNTIQEARVNINADRKNLIINGNPIVYQRAQSKTNATPYAYHTADRWRTSANGSQTGRVTDMSVVTNVDIGGDFIGNYVRYNHTTAASSPASNASYGYNYRIEKQDIIPYLGKRMVLSFYARTNANIAINSAFISGTTSSSIIIADPDDSKTWVNLTPDWKRYEYTFTLGTTVPTTHLDIGLRHRVDKVGYIDMSGVQLEEGGRATEFEHRSFAEEMVLCHRYYQQIEGYSDLIMFGSGRANGSTEAQVAVPLTVPLRASPSIPSLDYSAWGISNATGTTDGQPTVTRWFEDSSIIHLGFPSSGLDNARTVVVSCRNGSTLQLNSEL